MSPEARERSFDALATGLASGSISRGRALRLMGAALVGGTLASFPGVALAAKGGKSSCAKFCQSLFGANTPQEAQCVSQGTKGQGPCFTCTPETLCGPNFTKPTCTVTGQTYSCSTCQCECPSGQEVCGSTCGCPTGQTCQNGTCVTLGVTFICRCQESTEIICVPQECSDAAVDAVCSSVCGTGDGGPWTGVGSCRGTICD
jgi:hypothetical protein